MLTKTQTETMLDAEIQSALEQLAQTTKTSDEYRTIVENISKLHKLKTEESNTTVTNAVKAQEMESSDPRLKPLSLDTVLVVSANIFGILWLARYERENVIRSRSALGFVMKPRS